MSPLGQVSRIIVRESRRLNSRADMAYSWDTAKDFRSPESAEVVPDPSVFTDLRSRGEAESAPGLLERSGELAGALALLDDADDDHLLHEKLLLRNGDVAGATSVVEQRLAAAQAAGGGEAESLA